MAIRAARGGHSLDLDPGREVCDQLEGRLVVTVVQTQSTIAPLCGCGCVCVCVGGGGGGGEGGGGMTFTWT